MRKKGFTLIEILVVATIIAVLTALSIVSYTNINKRSRDTKRKSDIEQLRSALEMYRSDNGFYPNVGSGGWTDAANLGAGLVPTYIAGIPADPKSPTQVYRFQAKNFVSGNYYGYCLSGLIESETPTNTCTPDTVNGHNYGVKNP